MLTRVVDGFAADKPIRHIVCSIGMVRLASGKKESTGERKLSSDTSSRDTGRWLNHDSEQFDIPRRLKGKRGHPHPDFDGEADSTYQANYVLQINAWRYLVVHYS